jgi:hypothetical protein
VKLPTRGWVKAALHAHSKRSDGRLEPEDVVAFYRRAGFGVVALTDHNKVTKVAQPGFVPGIELEARAEGASGSYHVVVLGLSSEPPESVRRDANKLLEWSRDNGYFAFIAHPYWSMLSGEDLLRVRGYAGVEVYNHGCEVEISRGYSGPHWDYALSRGVASYGLAVDDSHNYSLDALGGWIALDIGEADGEEALRALLEGRFYASSGVAVESYEVGEGLLRVETSGAAHVKLLSGDTRGAYLSVELLERLASAEGLPVELERWEERGACFYRVKFGGTVAEVQARGKSIVRVELRGELPARKYARLELYDGEGRGAWLNPFPAR